MTKKFLSLLLVTTLAASMLTLSVFAQPAYNPAPTKDFAEEFVDFQNAEFTDGFDITTSGNPFRNNWTPDSVAGDKPVIKVDGDNKYLIARGFFEAVYDYTIDGGYMYEVDFKGATTAPTQGTLWVRGATERLPYKTFPSLWYYEEGPESICGGTGIAFWASEAKKANIAIKYRKDDAISNEVFTFDTDCDFNAGFQKVKFADNGSRVNIYLNNKLLLSIELSNKGTYGESAQEYYKTAVVKDAEGKVLKTIENALVAYAGELAFASRTCTFYIDNIRVSKYNAEADPGVKLPENPQTADNSVSYFAIVAVMSLAGIVIFKKRKVNA